MLSVDQGIKLSKHCYETQITKLFTQTQSAQIQIKAF